MARSPNTPLLLALVVCIMMIAGTLVGAVALAGRRPVVVVVPSGGSTGMTPPPAAPLAAASPIPSAAAASPAPTPAAIVAAVKPTEIVLRRISQLPALDDIFSAAWDQAAVSEIAVEPQRIAAPTLDNATIASITVQAAHDDRHVAWRLSWPAKQPSTSVETGTFTDAVAMQFPMVDGAPFTMGAKGMPVRLLHWKAVWQKDVTDGFQDVQKLYPNSWSDLYWFSSEGPGPTSLKSLSNPQADQYQVAHAAGNPMSNSARTQPVEEIAAEGFGSATSLPQSYSRAHGEWRDGRWTVVIDYPWDPQDALTARLLAMGPKAMVSLAVWDGSASNRGGRKHYCGWVPMRIEP